MVSSTKQNSIKTLQKRKENIFYEAINTESKISLLQENSRAIYFIII